MLNPGACALIDAQTDMWAEAWMKDSSVSLDMQDAIMEAILSAAIPTAPQDTTRFTVAQPKERHIQIPALEECCALLVAAPANCMAQITLCLISHATQNNECHPCIAMTFSHAIGALLQERQYCKTSVQSLAKLAACFVILATTVDLHDTEFVREIYRLWTHLHEDREAAIIGRILFTAAGVVAKK
ncbi:hypothetical protein BCR43DRAFT_38566 [Syncephalastrum racemosum]|uniref:Uncharacterized protein n=1 Tax=Syncephalastrum racemosum TaxID=13706 RepID=A0A1X2HUC0_SYNRA|nr:hypothetical protein BCR43DRAFT_38566 [Syncephalastrum racemosum]